jgi:hypothetical protein
MNRVPVESSVLASLLYLPEARLLEVEFHSGAFHPYWNVPPRCYNELLTATSKGAFFHTNIRNRFSSKPVEGPLRAGQAAP